MSASNQKLKSFVTEDEANDISAKKQEEWERVRRPEDPLERPPEDHRSLFEQLQEQKEKAQQEHDEKYNLKNMIRGIDNDEAAFLEFASQQQAEMDGRRFSVTSEVKEFRIEVAQLQAAITPTSSSNVKEKKKSPLTQSNKKSQIQLLAGVIKTKRKRSETSDEEQSKSQDQPVTPTEYEPSSSEKVEHEPNQKKQCPSEESDDVSSSTSTKENDNLSQQLAANIGYCYAKDYKPSSIPSLGVYSDSSDSESSSSDSEILPSLFRVGSNRK